MFLFMFSLLLFCPLFLSRTGCTRTETSRRPAPAGRRCRLFRIRPRFLVPCPPEYVGHGPRTLFAANERRRLAIPSVDLCTRIIITIPVRDYVYRNRTTTVFGFGVLVFFTEIFRTDLRVPAEQHIYPDRDFRCVPRRFLAKAEKMKKKNNPENDSIP